MTDIDGIELIHALAIEISFVSINHLAFVFAVAYIHNELTVAYARQASDWRRL